MESPKAGGFHQFHANDESAEMNCLPGYKNRYPASNFPVQIYFRPPEPAIDES